MAQNKKWKSFQEQLEIIKSRGLIIDNEQAALSYLDRIGYYRLSGYWYSFRQLADLSPGEKPYRKNKFIQGAHFEDAVKLYVFDKKLRLLALDALERIELSIRVDIAYILGEQDIYGHENSTLFHGNFTKKTHNGKTQHDKWLEKYESLVHRSRREPFAEHYLSKYGKLPVWVAIEVWDFGLLSKLFAGLNKRDQNTIAAKYGADRGKQLQSWLRSLNFIRNVSAHHSRLWNINVLERSPSNKSDAFWEQLNNARPFFYFCLMQQLMQVICPNSHWGQRVKSLINEFPEVGCGSVSTYDMGVIDNWQGWELWESPRE